MGDTVVRGLALMPLDLTLPEGIAEVLTLRCWVKPNGKQSNSKFDNENEARGKLKLQVSILRRLVCRECQEP